MIASDALKHDNSEITRLFVKDLPENWEEIVDYKHNFKKWWQEEWETYEMKIQKAREEKRKRSNKESCRRVEKPVELSDMPFG